MEELSESIKMGKRKLIDTENKASNRNNHVANKAMNCQENSSLHYKNKKIKNLMNAYNTELSRTLELQKNMQTSSNNKFDTCNTQMSVRKDESDNTNEMIKDLESKINTGTKHLEEGENSTDIENAKKCFERADSNFTDALLACRRLKGKMNKLKHLKIEVDILYDIASVKKLLHLYDDAIDYINETKSLCQSLNFYDKLHSCYTTEASVFWYKKNYEEALNSLNKAMDVITNNKLQGVKIYLGTSKASKMCETLSLKAFVLCQMSNYIEAKRVLIRAWKLKGVKKTQKISIEGTLKVVVGMCKKLKQLENTDPSEYITAKVLAETLGDGACRLDNYDDGIKYYLQALKIAKLDNHSGMKLQLLYVSLYATYRDLRFYNKALKYCKLEYDLIKSIPDEAYKTLRFMAETMFLAKRPYEHVEKVCLIAEKVAKELEEDKYQIYILGKLLNYQKLYNEKSKMKVTESKLKKFNVTLDLNNLESLLETGIPEDVDNTFIDNDICLDDLTDQSDTTEEDTNKKKSKTFKKRTNCLKNVEKRIITKKKLIKNSKTLDKKASIEAYNRNDDVDISVSNNIQENTELEEVDKVFNPPDDDPRASRNKKINLQQKKKKEPCNSTSETMRSKSNKKDVQQNKILQSAKNGWPLTQEQTQVLSRVAVKVQVEDKMLTITLKLDKIDEMTVSWLIEEVKYRYHKLKGLRPVFSLCTSDGEVLSETDPLSLVLSSPELKTCITQWKVSQAEEMYLTHCKGLNIPPSEEIQQAINKSYKTQQFALVAKTLATTQIEPIFKALSQQSHITMIKVSENNIGDTGCKDLAKCVFAMKYLTHLDISRNNITKDGAQSLINLLEKAKRFDCRILEELDISSNPITDIGFNLIIKLCQFVRLKVLKMNFCGITEKAITDNKHNILNFESVESFDISNNDIKQGGVSNLLSSLNPNVVVDLRLDRIGVKGDVVDSIEKFLESADEVKLKILRLSNCTLKNENFETLYRSLRHAKDLQSITLKNNCLSFLPLKNLLERKPLIPVINLEGCQDIFDFSSFSHIQDWLPKIDFGKCIPEITVTPMTKNYKDQEFLELFSSTWLKCFEGRGVIEYSSRSMEYYDNDAIKFTAKS